MTEVSASSLVFDALRTAEDGQLVLAPELQEALSKDLELRAALPGAEADLSELLRLAAFLGVEKQNPAVASALASALAPMIAAMTARNQAATESAEAQRGSARQLIGAPASATALQGEGILASAKKGGLGAELSERFKSEYVRSPQRPSRKPK